MEPTKAEDIALFKRLVGILLEDEAKCADCARAKAELALNPPAPIVYTAHPRRMSDYGGRMVPKAGRHPRAVTHQSGRQGPGLCNMHQNIRSNLALRGLKTWG